MKAAHLVVIRSKRDDDDARNRVPSLHQFLPNTFRGFLRLVRTDVNIHPVLTLMRYNSDPTLGGKRIAAWCREQREDDQSCNDDEESYTKARGLWSGGRLMSSLLKQTFLACVIIFGLSMLARSDPLPPSTTYRPLPSVPFSVVKVNDEAQKAAVIQRQAALFSQRYDLADRPIPGVMMSGGQKAIQGGVRVKLPAGVTWQSLAQMSPDEIREKNLLP
ncbi:MAG: hypothetical protein JO166_21030, partial [Deltaproteobacteria bacterium]|nr:hypothetical protein [Deltaproteobacteria bacterium]